jgi:hypothetical protein
MSDELLDKLDAWGRSEASSTRAGADELPMVRLMGEVRRVRRVRAALKAGAALLVLAIIAGLLFAALRSAPPPRKAPVQEPPLRAIDR